MTVFEGGQKSPAHIDGQARLERIFNTRRLITKQEDPVWLFDDFDDLRQYQVDVMVMTLKNINLLALEVDTYGPHQGKRKNVANMSNRDILISRRYKIPVIRWDVDCLKIGRLKTKYYMTDDEIYNYSMGKAYKWYKDNAVLIEGNTLINLD